MTAKFSLGQKDIRLALAAAEDLRVPMPLASLLRDRFLTLLAHDGDSGSHGKNTSRKPMMSL
jgi:3-hydroxyisobutyrate dehydrogenase-like beta-hydroxyacid dehydrogenase